MREEEREGGKEVRREGGGETRNLLEGDVANSPSIDTFQNIPHLNTLTKHGIMVLNKLESARAHTPCVCTHKSVAREERDITRILPSWIAEPLLRIDATMISF